MTREALIMNKEYWVADIQSKLYEALENYRTENGLNRTQLAEALGFSKGYISRILNGDFDHRISKLVELTLKIGLVPQMSFAQIGEKDNATQAKHKSAQEKVACLKQAFAASSTTGKAIKLAS